MVEANCTIYGTVTVCTQIRNYLFHNSLKLENFKYLMLHYFFTQLFLDIKKKPVANMIILEMK